jgi:predicted lipoprotein with Yx(FWY)xxD motif
LGLILVDSAGHTLYLFKADSSTSSACSGACAVAWPPLRTGDTPAVAGGASPALIGTIPRSDGARQVTYDGHPLYTFVKDHKPGDINGQGLTAFGAGWFVVSPAGDQISSQPAAHGSGSASRPAAPAAPPAAKAQPAPKAAPPPVAKPTPPASNGIPQNNGGDGDSDNNGGPSDGDGNV